MNLKRNENETERKLIRNEIKIKIKRGRTLFNGLRASSDLDLRGLIATVRAPLLILYYRMGFGMSTFSAKFFKKIFGVSWIRLFIRSETAGAPAFLFLYWFSTKLFIISGSIRSEKEKTPFFTGSIGFCFVNGV